MATTRMKYVYNFETSMCISGPKPNAKRLDFLSLTRHISLDA